MTGEWSFLPVKLSFLLDIIDVISWPSIILSPVASLAIIFTSTVDTVGFFF